MIDRVHLSRLIEEEGVTFEGNTLIVAPIGTGKSFFVFENFDENSLLLIPSNLSKRVFVSMLNKFAKVGSYNNSVMTYKEFGMLLNKNENFADRYAKIFCEEFQKLFHYDNMGDHHSITVDKLLEVKEGQEKYYLTPVRSELPEIIEKMAEGSDNLDKIKILDYNDHEALKIKL